MAKLISASIDLTKIDKSKIVSVNKQGQPFANGAKYLNVTIAVNDERNEYDQDTSIYIQQSKGEREAKQNRTYIGNGKIVWSSNPVAESIPVAEEVTDEEDDTGLPF